MNASSESYTFKRVQEMLGLSRAVLNGLIDAGFVTPQRGVRNEHRFTFQDLVLLRTAYGLRQAQIPPRKILNALRCLRTTLPQEIPLSGLRISAIGSDVVVRDRDGPRTADSGQLVMDFEVGAEGGSVSFISPADSSNDAEAWFVRGEELEERDPTEAEKAYRHAIAKAPDHLYAYLNLGAWLCEEGRCEEAAKLFEDALRHGLHDPSLYFNHAIALEDLGRYETAIDSYHKALELDPSFADAHYNAARLMHQAGDFQGALRHFNAYRRLQRELNEP